MIFDEILLGYHSMLDGLIPIPGSFIGFPQLVMNPAMG
jgi:hypothetical protein